MDPPRDVGGDDYFGTEESVGSDRDGTQEGNGPWAWPPLASLGLGPAERAARRAGIGGSDANTILSGSDERILQLWREKRGECADEDLSDKLAVMLGCWTEPFNRAWYEKTSGYPVTRVGEVVRCAINPWRSGTLDGFVEPLGAVWEAKHTSGFAKPAEVVERYMPQLQHNMAVAGCQRALLSILFGNGKWECFEIAADWLYQQDLLEAEARFWTCVQSGEPPVAAPAPPPPRPVGVREVCLEGHNLWAASAADWLAHGAAAKAHAAACTTLRGLVEDDVARAFGHGIEARRSKAGAITIRAVGP
ncbi:YqaJ viral recombinase family protein [Novosphingobium tardum]